MIGKHLRSTVGLALTGLVMTACASQNTESDVPDFVLQHTLSSLTNKQSFAWNTPRGQTLVISPLGTFRRGDDYCRDYEIGRDDVGSEAVKRTACRFDERWTKVDPAGLDP